MMEMKHAKANTHSLSNLLFILVMPLSLLWMELIFRIATVRPFWGLGLFYTFGFTLAIGVLMYVLFTFFDSKINNVIVTVALGLFALLYCVQIVYYGCFGEYCILYSIGTAGHAAQFWRETLKSILNNLLPILAMFVPMVLYIIFGFKWLPARRTPVFVKLAGVSLAIFVYIASMLLVLLNGLGDPSPRMLYTGYFSASDSVREFGLLTELGLDLRYLVFGTSVTDDLDQPSSLPTDPEPTPEETPVVYKDNVIESLDFAALAEAETNKTYKSMHQYFDSVTPTKQNEYTGKFAGKNLIFIVAEGFSPYAVSEELTPTLYKLSHEGIQCTDYYTPGWGVSTSDGEYTSLLGLMPATGVHSMEYSSDRNMYFALGNQFKRAGYTTKAYHNHTYTYYGRDTSHPNMGYDYKGIGNGLTLDYSSYYEKHYSTRWPNSDYLMAVATEEEYMNEQPFHTYYLTVSGHMLYTFMGNSMSSYHKSKVADLPYSDSVKAYLACQIELDLMLEELVSTLQEKGIADDTVIVLTADHYPYGLQMNNEPDYYSELAGYDTSSTFEKYKNTLIIWHEGLESIIVDEPTYSIDLLPTLSNLFGLEYDSRLMMGRDFLSDSPSLVCFSNRSWITDKGKYDSKTKVFTPNEGVVVEEDYAKTVTSIVSRKFTYSNLILKEDYYDRILGE